ncbi:MAG: ABC transporter permease [Burkholderiaceae bacterium]|nr:SMP-30/gluconolactonase/LRE family protein [Burkholderiales bacterium]TAL68506.1 MAG: ABC transporter permease [Burkholderiaceae bacterium]TBR77367.1 MAG: ABC transporter permease [Burkholderiaceae bacterium]
MTTSALLVNAKRLRYKWSLRQIFADLFAKTWMEPAVPFTVLVLLILGFALIVPHYLSVYNAQSLSRFFSEFGFVAIAMALTLMSGGIDLSVGSTFALCNFVALACFTLLGLPVPLAIAVTLAAGALLGAVNGVFIGFLRTRPFLTTLVTLIVYRGIYDLLSQRYSPAIVMSTASSKFWDWLGNGGFLGLPSTLCALIVLGVIGHILLSRSRLGWHLIAVGSSRRSARHAGISTEKVLFSTYVVSGFACAVGAVFFATRLNSTGPDVGENYALEMLAAVMIGGVSLAGGKGSIGRALIGTGIIFLISNGLAQLGYSGDVATAVNGAILLLAISIDVKWSKNRGKAIQKSYVNPTYVDYGALPDTRAGTGSPYAMNDRLTHSEAIGLNQIEGPEDVILDREGRLYGGTRLGTIVRFSGQNFEHREVFAHTGGRPLGLAFDKDDNLIVCVSGMGLYGVKPDGQVFKLTDETNRSWFKLVDDSRLKLTDDLDIGADGKIYFSEATTRFDLATWPVDGLEGRGSGRLVCYDPATRRTRTLVDNIRFCNGICMAHDNQSLLYAETFGMRLMRYWVAGPNKGRVEVVIGNLPGSPDNINRASDGGYWLALVAMRTPVTDIAMRHPGFRMRMIKRMPTDEWLLPNVNNGCIVKLDASCRPVTSYWDPSAESHPTLTSMREDRGYLYLGGLENNRIGRVKLEGADPSWVSSECYWGKRSSNTA